MNSDLYFDGKQFISSSRAAKISGYVNDYIGQLCRDGKLDCRMVGRTWYVSFESLINHKNANGSASKNRSKKPLEILASNLPVEALQTLNPAVTPALFPAATAPVISTFSTPFLPSDSKPRTWFSPKVSYPIFRDEVHVLVKVVEETVAKGASEKTENTSLEKTFVGVSFPDFSYEKKLFVSNIPAQKIFDREAKKVSSLTHFETSSLFFSRAFPTAFALMISFIFAFAGFLFAVRANPTAQVAYNSAFHSLRDEVGVSGEVATLRLQASVFSGVGSVLDQAGLAVYHAVNNFLFDTRERILVMSGVEVEKKVSVVKQTDNEPTSPSQGMVVVPVDDKTNREATIAKIKDAFSDEVSVKPASDNASGVITPVFKKVKGDDYLYVLVPIKN